jgi:hypothetical protein
MQRQQLAIRIQDGNPNHHLRKNSGTWFVHYTVHPDAPTSLRIRRSLGTRRLETTRWERDRLFALIQASNASLKQNPVSGGTPPIGFGEGGVR